MVGEDRRGGKIGEWSMRKDKIGYVWKGCGINLENTKEPKISTSLAIHLSKAAGRKSFSSRWFTEQTSRIWVLVCIQTE